MEILFNFLFFKIEIHEKYYLISYFWKLEIKRNIAIIYEIIFLDFEKNGKRYLEL
jgi:hypothetical protein